MRIVIGIFRKRCSRSHVSATHIYFMKENAGVCPKDRHLHLRGGGYISLLKAYLSKKLPFLGKSPDEQRKSSYSPSKRKHRLVLGVQLLLSTPGSSRPRVTRIHVTSRTHIHVHTLPTKWYSRVKWQPPSSRILRTFIDHYIPAGVNFSTYLVSWLASSKIFSIPFHCNGKGRL